MSDAEVAELNPVSCSSCRAKKCKVGNPNTKTGNRPLTIRQCNRALPSCVQCVKAHLSCSYPESFKRGFPEGYLQGLEKRLVETEIALFESLTLLSSSALGLQLAGDPPQAAEAFQQLALKQSKTERSKEWNRLPLESYEQRSRWRAEKHQQLGLGQIAPMDRDEQQYKDQGQRELLHPTQPPSDPVTVQNTSAFNFNLPLLGDNQMQYDTSNQPSLNAGRPTPNTQPLPRSSITRQWSSSVSSSATGGLQSNSEITQPQAQTDTDRAHALSVRQSARFF